MMGVATVVVVVLYFSVLAFIAYWAARKNAPNPEDFFNNDVKDIKHMGTIEMSGLAEHMLGSEYRYSTS